MKNETAAAAVLEPTAERLQALDDALAELSGVALAEALADVAALAIFQGRIPELKAIMVRHGDRVAAAPMGFAPTKGRGRTVRGRVHHPRIKATIDWSDAL
ncbi:MAG: hypothetical protein IT381_25620 [Deltaproteobacteria bacterium]|nr:hypothetical protein [Deltaproteobacteria bacterium]